MVKIWFPATFSKKCNKHDPISIIFRADRCCQTVMRFDKTAHQLGLFPVQTLNGCVCVCVHFTCALCFSHRAGWLLCSGWFKCCSMHIDWSKFADSRCTTHTRMHSRLMMLSTHLHKMLKAHSFYLHHQCLDSVVFIVVFQPSTMRVCVILNVSLSLLLCTACVSSPCFYLFFVLLLQLC